MLFNSWRYLLFFAAVLGVYWLLDRKKQNVLLVLASYFFYGVWDWRFTGLLLGTTIVGFVCGRKIHEAAAAKDRRFWLILCVVYNLGTLAVFKYLGFFLDNFLALLARFGVESEPVFLRIILPVGISFFNFHVLSYAIDLYRKEIEPTPRFADFALFVSFFPLLVAGPIERAKHLLPQIAAPRRLDGMMVRQGLWLLFWGLWKKVFVAENLSPYVDQAFANSAALSLPELYLAAVAFAFQIYCDFSGYTDLARGSAKLMGFDLLNNFNLPYFAANPSDFWKRWHISLSSWLRDYLYISLGGNRKGKAKTYRNLFLTMVIGGLWHGAAWNFVLWGVFHGLILIVHHAWSAAASVRPPKWIAIAIMSQFTLIGWILFRANRTVALDHRLADDSLRQIGELFGAFGRGFQGGIGLLADAPTIALIILPLLAIQVVKYLWNDQFWIFRLPWAYSACIQAFLAFLLIRFGVQAGDSFIYFQF